MLEKVEKLVEEILISTAKPDCPTIHLPPEMARAIATGYQKMALDNASLRKKIIENLPEIAKRERAKWADG